MREQYPKVRIEVFNNGAALLQYLDKYDRPELPRCILLEYMMPGLSGPEILQAIGFLPQFKDVPKVVWATLAFEKEISECLALGATRVYTKPYSYSDQRTLLKSLYTEFIANDPYTPSAEVGEATA